MQIARAALLPPSPASIRRSIAQHKAAAHLPGTWGGGNYPTDSYSCFTGQGVTATSPHSAIP